MMKTVLEEGEEEAAGSFSMIPPPLPPGMVSRGKESSRKERYQQHITNLQKSAEKQPEQPTSEQQQTSPAPTILNHLQDAWPGQGSEKNQRHLDVRPMLFSRLLTSQKIVIPLFQRRYCWTRDQISQWWHDVAISSGGTHGTHKTMFKKDHDGTLLCIDGQQRVTTCTLLLMALRATVRQHDPTSPLMVKIDKILLPGAVAIEGMQRWAKYRAFQMIRNQQSTSTFHNKDDNGLDGNDTCPTTSEKSYRFIMEAPEPGWLPPFATRLTPSHIDRSSYYELLCRDHVLEAIEQQLERSAQNAMTIQLLSSDACQESAQYQAHNIFTAGLQQQLDNTSPAINCNSTPATRMIVFCNKIARKQLDGFSLMYIELLTEGNMQQVFLWMQEKSVFGMGKLLYNPHPGVDFTPLDLARNVVVSCVMDAPDLQTQMDMYRSCWVEPLEGRFGTPRCSQILRAFVNATASTDPTRYIGDMEKKLQEYKKAAPPACSDAFQNNAPMMIYARFHSYVQQRAMQLEGNSDSITRRVADAVVQDLVAMGELMMS